MKLIGKAVDQGIEGFEFRLFCLKHLELISVLRTQTFGLLFLTPQRVSKMMIKAFSRLLDITSLQLLPDPTPLSLPRAGSLSRDRRDHFRVNTR